jgi:hypothetical protein
MTIRPFVFSCDAHVSEPRDLFTTHMPERFGDHVINMREENGRRMMCVGDRVVLHFPPTSLPTRPG